MSEKTVLAWVCAAESDLRPGDPSHGVRRRQQLEALAARLQEERWDAIYVSPAEASWETAVTLGARLATSVHPEPRLAPGSTVADFGAHILAAHAGRRVLAVCPPEPIATFVAGLTGGAVVDIPFRHGSVSLTLHHQERWTMAELNDSSHLAQLATLTAADPRTAHLEAIVENVEDGLVLVDRDGIIIYINQPYLQFLGIKSEQAVGRPVADVIENTRMHVVVRTGVPEIGWTQKIKGQEMVVKRLPIVRNGEIVGAVGSVMFKDVSELRTLAANVGVLQAKVEYYERELRSLRGSRYTFDHIIGNGQAKEVARRAALSGASILLLGESGTGKELFAHAIHHASPRAPGAFVRMNCAAIPTELMEAELFGYEEGAFTGARKGGKPGKFELAQHGTLFLDEIGDMPLAMQAKILRVLQEREVERVGSLRPFPVDVRIIAATHRDLKAMVASGEFREDLYYRLNVISVTIPPLRDRPEDIPLLVDYYLKKLADEQGVMPKRLTADALAAMVQYRWPGNARELVNLLERMTLTVDGTVVTLADLPEGIAMRAREREAEPHALAYLRAAGDSEPAPLDAAVTSTERREILRALELTGGNRSRAAKLLGIHRATLHEKLRRHQIDRL